MSSAAWIPSPSRKARATSASADWLNVATQTMSLMGRCLARSHILLLRTARFRRRTCCFATPLEDCLRVRHRENDGLEVLTEVRLPTGCPQLGEEWMNFAERSEDLAVRGAECQRIDRTGGYERGRHVPVAEHHAKRGIALSAGDRQKLSEALRIEIAQEPGARFAQDRLATQVVKPQVQNRTLEGSRHKVE